MREQNKNTKTDKKFEAFDHISQKLEKCLILKENNEFKLIDFNNDNHIITNNHDLQNIFQNSNQSILKLKLIDHKNSINHNNNNQGKFSLNQGK